MEKIKTINTQETQQAQLMGRFKKAFRVAIVAVATMSGVSAMSTDAEAHKVNYCDHVHGPEGTPDYAIIFYEKNNKKCIRKIIRKYENIFKVTPTVITGAAAMRYAREHYGVNLDKVRGHCIRVRRVQSVYGSTQWIDRKKAAKQSIRKRRTSKRKTRKVRKASRPFVRDCMGRKFYLPNRIPTICRK